MALHEYLRENAHLGETENVLILNVWLGVELI